MTDALSEKQPTAVLFRRYLAHILDLAFISGMVAITYLLLADQVSVGRPPGQGYFDVSSDSSTYVVRVGGRLFVQDRPLTSDDLTILVAVAVGFLFVFSVLIQGRFGWTIGKLLTGIRTVGKNGDHPGVLSALFRTILLPIDALPSDLLPLVAGITAMTRDDNRRLGDLVARTYVVRRSAVGQDPTGGGIDTTGWEPLDDERSPVTTLAEGEALRVGDRAEPAATETFTAPAAEAGSAKAPAYQPQWDPARQAYLQWHPGKQQWLQFDEPSGEWRPIG